MQYFESCSVLPKGLIKALSKRLDRICTYLTNSGRVHLEVYVLVRMHVASIQLQNVGLVCLAKSFETCISQVDERLHSTISGLRSAMQNSILYFGPTSDRQWWSVCQTPKAVGMADSNLIRFILRNKD